ncbi:MULTISPECIES: ThiF family adenylyltransferase [unclassified Streptomyces]|uniref:ThiF family adenylyltransferase n=1 Tax=unclassified Streptomyces TaxID=2593676 RepID=UPI002E16DEFC|nr:MULTISPECIES: ThiF family adenylyltransferase [unclassified Streptomyces]
MNADLLGRRSAAPSRPWHLTAFRVPADGARRPTGTALVDRVRELRARILYDNGRRPDFRTASGDHVDDQHLDFGAWHFVGRRTADGPPLGYVRLSTPDTGERFQSREYLGAEAYAQLLLDSGLGTGETYEHSRLVVEHHARKLGLGVQLNALALAAARHLGAKTMVGTSGTKDGQDAFHARFGFRPVDGTRRYVEHYTEDVVLLMCRIGDAAGDYSDLVAEYTDLFPQLVVDAETVRLDLPAMREEAPATLAAALASARTEHAPDRRSWRPEPVDGPGELRALLASGRVREVHDTIEQQIAELVRSREPGPRYDDPAELAAARERQLDGAEPWEYGSWFFHPWSGRLVHVLPAPEFRMVRTDRNRGKIDRPEQRRLLDRRIGVIGLSVGSASALTLAMEGIGGAYRLADFDTLSLSNLNRLRAAAHDVGVNKCVLAARQMYEIDPYLDIEIFPGGLTDEVMEEFFTADGGIDLLVEECDTPYVKLAARERARALGVPVLMDANDRGLLDVERFDLEPERRLLHGRLGATCAADVAGELSFEETVDLILAMVDADRISPELAAAIPLIGTTYSSWPQLASGVALGGALTADAARRVLLGRPLASGRYYTDFDALLAPDRSTVR